MILFVLPARTHLEEQGRVMGWRQVTADRASLRELKQLVPRLRELGATKVVVSDLDGQSGWLLGRRLNVGVEEWHSLRRFNVGKHHGEAGEQFEKLRTQLVEKWKSNPDIPVKGGDSLKSFTKRMSASRDKLKSQGTATVVVADAKTVAALIDAPDAKLEHGRVYQWQTS
jgi:broad specificity phosphatase PhoE